MNLKKLKRMLAFTLALITAICICLPASVYATTTVNSTNLYATSFANSTTSSGHVAEYWVFTVRDEPLRIDYDGTYLNIQNISHHAIKVGDSWYNAYCLNPVEQDTVKNYAGSNPGAEEDWGENLTIAQQYAIQRALLYGYPNKLASDSDTRLDKEAKYIATQIVIWEFILGWRETTFPYTLINGSLRNAFDGECRVGGIYGTEGTTTDVITYYDQIVNAIIKHSLIPSFAAQLSSRAPTYEMEADGNGNYTLTLVDTNNILSEYTFANTPTVSYVKNGNQLVIMSTAPITAAETISPTRPVPSTDNTGKLFIWQCDGAQSMAALIGDVPDDPEPAYFKLKTAEENGTLSVRKNTNTGNELDGWAFGVYSDSKCNTLIGKISTDDNGEGSMTIKAGTYYIKELPEESERFDDYWQCDTTVQMIIVEAGQTSTVTFHNAQYGRLHIQKELLNGNASVSNWQFNIYAGDTTNAEQLLEGSPFTTNELGSVIKALTPGTYTVEELPPKDSLYICTNGNPKTIEILPGATTELTFKNALRPGKIEIVKNDLAGSPLSGAKFLLEWSEDGIIWDEVFINESDVLVMGGCSNEDLLDGCLITDINGEIVFENLYPGIFYRVKEVEAPLGYITQQEIIFKSRITFENLNVKLQVNNEQKKYPVTISKTDLTTSDPVPGALVTIRNEDGDIVYEELTNEDGVLPNIMLHPGKYSFEESLAPDGYIRETKSFNFTIHLDGTVDGVTSFTNRKTEVIIMKADINTGTPLENATIEIFDEQGNVVYTGVTNKDGKLIVTGLKLNHNYCAIEKGAPEGYAISDKAHYFKIKEDGTVTGTTTIKDDLTQFIVHKVDDNGNPITGVEFTMADTNGNMLAYAITDENGDAVFRKFGVGTFIISETGTPEGYEPNSKPITIVNDGTWDNDSTDAMAVFVNKEIAAPPQTGDETNLAALFAAASLALLGICFIVRSQRKEAAQ